MTRNARETDRAWSAVQQAVQSAKAVTALPAEPGSQVRWPHNGTVWQRVADDEWIVPGHEHWPYDSAHVASFPYQVLEVTE